MIYLHFIVNPISGKGKHKIDKMFLANFFPPSKYNIEIDFSKYKKHAILLTQEAIVQKPDMIVACGGDGTINEVASELINVPIALGIIPLGSGNGLASNLNISRDIKKAIANIKAHRIKTIDVGRVNNCYFFSNMGLGIDALIIKKYEENKQRTLSAYLKAIMKSIVTYTPPRVKIHDNHGEIIISPFLLFISNSNEMGYKMSLTPRANLCDGVLDVFVIPKTTIFYTLYLGILVLIGKIDRIYKAQKYQTQSIKIEVLDTKETYLQIDGEFHHFLTNKLKISVLPSALKIVVGRSFKG